MSRSARPLSSQLHALRHLTRECLDFGDDPLLWRRHWFAGIARLTDADLVVGGEKTWPKTNGSPVSLGTTEWGWENGFDPVGWIHAVAEFERDPTYSPAENRYIARLHRQDGIALSRADLLRDRSWYRSSNYLGIQRVIGVDHTLFCYHSIPGTRGDELNGIILTRASGRRDFNVREKAVLQAGHALAAPFVGGALARFADAAPSALPARARQVLRCLLEGDSDKQVALRLGITRNTVNQYAKAIFRHFGVASRTELLAKWVRRRWGERMEEAGAAHLADRVRQVLHCLLEGDGDKQIVNRLGITRNTVNQYTKTIYQHFGVNSRGELLARWVAGANGARFVWAEAE